MNKIYGIIYFRITMLLAMLIAICNGLAAQAKLVVNGGVIVLKNGASLVIENADNAAIIRNGSGYIQSEAEGNKIIWAIGSGNGKTYLLPFGNSSSYIPLVFNAASGSANGKIIFSTYPTTWENSNDLPAGITNVNKAGIDNSAKIADRFWQIDPQGYAVKPTLNNLSFAYTDLENKYPNIIIEKKLRAQRWSGSLDTWDDYMPSSVADTIKNTVTISALPGSQLYSWWTLIDPDASLPTAILNFKALAINKKVEASWQTSSENNSRVFEIWRAKIVPRFELVGAVAAAGNSNNLLSYSLPDATPYAGISYYRLKCINLDGSFTWSDLAKVIIGDEAYISLYPNPATVSLSMAVSSGIAAAAPKASIYDSRGSLVRSFIISNSLQQINIARLAPGVYRINFIYNDQPFTQVFIKN